MRQRRQRGGGLLFLVHLKSAHPPIPFDTLVTELHTTSTPTPPVILQLCVVVFFCLLSFFLGGGGQYVVGAGTETFYTTDAVELGGWVQIAFGRWQWGRLFNNQLPTIRSRSLFNTILTLTSSHQKVTFVQLDQLLIQSG